LLVGSKGSIYSDCPWNTRFVLLPKAKYQNIKAGPPETIPVSVGHHREWVEACKGKGKTFSPFELPKSSPKTRAAKNSGGCPSTRFVISAQASKSSAQGDKIVVSDFHRDTSPLPHYIVRVPKPPPAALASSSSQRLEGCGLRR
jgi:hypothetical protein